MAKCELNCPECKIKDCSFRTLNAFKNSGKGTTVEAAISHSQTSGQLHTRIDAKEAAKRIKGTSGGGFGGVPPAIETDPSLYITDQSKVNKNSGS